VNAETGSWINRHLLAVMASLILPALADAAPDWTVGLQELDLSRMSQGWGSPQVDKSVGGGPLAIGGRTFAHGVGTHAIGEFALDLHGTARRFSAWVGVDDDASPPGSVTFQLRGDGRVLWDSGIMRAGAPAREVGVDLQGVQRLTLRVGDAGDGNGMDHADWAEAAIAGMGPRPSPSPYALDLGHLRNLDLTPIGAAAIRPATGWPPTRNISNAMGSRGSWFRGKCIRRGIRPGNGRSNS